MLIFILKSSDTIEPDFWREWRGFVPLFDAMLTLTSVISSFYMKFSFDVNDWSLEWPAVFT